ncbi:TatD family hydrolase [Oceanobacillus sp. HCA-5259]
MQRMLTNGYFISVTPDIIYKPKIQRIAKQYPLEQLMVETDGPWQFSGPFENKRTHPKMMHESVKVIAHLKQIDRTAVYQQIYENTRSFFTL